MCVEIRGRFGKRNFIRQARESSDNEKKQGMGAHTTSVIRCNGRARKLRERRNLRWKNPPKSRSSDNSDTSDCEEPRRDAVIHHFGNRDKRQSNNRKRNQVVRTCEQVAEAVFRRRMPRVRRNLRGESGEQSADQKSQIHNAARIRTWAQMVKRCLMNTRLTASIAPRRPSKPSASFPLRR